MFLKAVSNLVLQFFRGRRLAANDTTTVSSVDSIPTDLNANIARQPGLDCPRCHARIQMTIDMLLSDRAIVCPACLLSLHVDRNKSQETLEALKTLKAALDKANGMIR